MRSKIFILFFFILLILNFNVVNAEDVKIPEWVFIVYDFWIEEKISDKEFIDMVDYLEKQDIVDLILPPGYDARTNFFLSITEISNPELYPLCSDGWDVTGYFIPVEEDYSAKFIPISINEEPREFRQDFVNVVAIEGWGKTLSGDYLGWYDDSFHISPIPLDSEGNLLKAGLVAIDEKVIDHDAKILISTLPYPWNEIVYLAHDVGPAIKGKHIDLYTGEGKQAEFETFRVTSSNNIVCE